MTTAKLRSNIGDLRFTRGAHDGKHLHLTSLPRYLLNEESSALAGAGHGAKDMGVHWWHCSRSQDDRLAVGGVEDHIHALVTAPPTIAPFQIAQYLKSDSSKWIHEEFPTLRNFRWQDGYGAFTVSKSNIPTVIKYIRNQREHHRKKTFQEEYLEFLRENGVDYDERYLWG